MKAKKGDFRGGKFRVYRPSAKLLKAATDMQAPPKPTTEYEILKAVGHSPQKAAEIILDAKRGDIFSINYIEACKQKIAFANGPLLLGL